MGVREGIERGVISPTNVLSPTNSTPNTPLLRPLATPPPMDTIPSPKDAEDAVNSTYRNTPIINPK
jgi:hypothetical protein